MNLRLRPATTEDADRLLEWANDEVGRRNSFDTAPILRETHLQWFAEKLARPDQTRIYIAELTPGGEPAGQIRFDRSGTEAVIDYALAPAARGRGLAKELLLLGGRRIYADWVDVQTLVGHVKLQNVPSRKAFARAGFTASDATQDEVVFMSRRAHRNFVVAASRPWYAGIDQRLESRVGGQFTLLTRPDEVNPSMLASLQPHWVFFPHWSSLIPPDVYESFPCVVFHMTALPYGRGGSPLQNLIVRGHRDTVVSAIDVTREVDAGDIYLQRPLSLDGSAQDIMLRSVSVIESMIADIIATDPPPVSQRGPVVAFRRRKPEQGNIADLTSAADVYNHIRMLDAVGYPHAFLDAGKLHLEFTQATLDGNTVDAHVRITFHDSSKE